MFFFPKNNKICCTIIWQVRVVKIKLRNCVNIFDGRKPVPEKNSMYNKKAQIKSLKYPIMIVHWSTELKSKLCQFNVQICKSLTQIGRCYQLCIMLAGYLSRWTAFPTIFGHNMAKTFITSICINILITSSMLIGQINASWENSRVYLWAVTKKTRQFLP